MAYRPSKRIKGAYYEAEADLTPMMNLMVVLIPLLLTTAEFVRLGVIDINLPPAAQEVEGMESAVVDKLDLALTITDKGYFISSNLAVLSGGIPGEPTIPLVRGENDSLIYDYEALSRKLYDIKNRLREIIKKSGIGQYPDSTRIILTAEPDVLYQTVISTMDAARSVLIDGKLERLFADVSLSPGVF